MQIAHSLAELATLPNAQAPSVVTIGNFDGVHLGHQTVIAQVIHRAKALSTPAQSARSHAHTRSVVVTFHPHPSHVLPHATPAPLITPLPRKLELLAQTGVDLTLVLPFTESLYTLTARGFAQTILCDALHTLEIHEGETFRFGHRAEGDLAHLTDLGRALCFTVHPFHPVLRRGAPVSSSRIRTLLAAGDTQTTRALLGRPFTLDSTPAPGRGYGTRYAVPTINLAIPAPPPQTPIPTPQPPTPTPHPSNPTPPTPTSLPQTSNPTPPTPTSLPQTSNLTSQTSTPLPQTSNLISPTSTSPDTPHLLPAHGVYITTLRIGTGPDAPVFQGVTNAGNRPTFGPDSYAIETHLLNFHPLPLTETTPLRLTFLAHLRPEQRFPSPDLLKAQILQDVTKAQRFFHLCALRNIPY